MKILVKFNKNIATPKQVKSFKVFDLGEVVTTIDDLLDVSSIQITDDILPILKITDEDGEKQYLVNGLGEPSNGIIPYYTDDFEKDITIDDLVLVGGSGGSSEPAYKVYTALLSQSGTDAPVATILENTLGGIPTFTYDGVGVYTITLTGLLTANKRTFNVFTTRLIDGANGETVESDEIQEDDNSIRFITYSGDTSSGNTPLNEWTKRIEIRVYN